MPLRSNSAGPTTKLHLKPRIWAKNWEVQHQEQLFNRVSVHQDGLFLWRLNSLCCWSLPSASIPRGAVGPLSFCRNGNGCAVVFPEDYSLLLCICFCVLSILLLLIISVSVTQESHLCFTRLTHLGRFDHHFNNCHELLGEWKGRSSWHSHFLWFCSVSSLIGRFNSLPIKFGNNLLINRVWKQHHPTTGI